MIGMCTVSCCLPPSLDSTTKWTIKGCTYTTGFHEPGLRWKRSKISSWRQHTDRHCCLSAIRHHSRVLLSRTDSTSRTRTRTCGPVSRSSRILENEDFPWRQQHCHSSKSWFRVGPPGGHLQLVCFPSCECLCVTQIVIYQRVRSPDWPSFASIRVGLRGWLLNRSLCYYQFFILLESCNLSTVNNCREADRIRKQKYVRSGW